MQEAVNKLIKVTDTVRPDPVIAAKYERKYQAYRQLYPALKEIFPQL